MSFTDPGILPPDQTGLRYVYLKWNGDKGVENRALEFMFGQSPSSDAKHLQHHGNARLLVHH